MQLLTKSVKLKTNIILIIQLSFMKFKSVCLMGGWVARVALQLYGLRPTQPFARSLSRCRWLLAANGEELPRHCEEATCV